MAVDVETLAAYLPEIWLDWLADTTDVVPSLPPTPGAALLSDISGFTALAERLARRGPEGVDELAGRINAYFERRIGLVRSLGGDVLKLAGDALIAFWPAAPGPDGLTEAVWRAADCGLAISGDPSTLDANLPTKVGLGVGTIRGLGLGGVLNRRELILDGTPLVQVGKAEHHAGPGQSIASPETWEILSAFAEGEPIGEGFVRLTRLNSSPPPWSPPASSRRPPVDVIRAYLPGAIRSRLDAGQDRWLSELRRVSVLFVGLNALGSLLTDDPGRAQAIFEAVQEEIYRVEGGMNKVGIDDKGLSLLIALGLPPLSHRDDPERALLAAIAIRERLAGLGLPCAIGVTTGRAFCGEIGSVSRREYTLIGDVVNLAARLMQAGRGDGLLCDVETRRAVGDRFHFEALAPIPLKGKAEPVPTFRPSRAFADRVDFGVGGRPLVGRLGELRRLDEALADLAEGRGGVVAIEGEAGIGKSRLIDGWSMTARNRGILVLAGEAHAIERSTPYRAWRTIVTGLLGLGDLAKAGEVRDRLATRLADAPELLRLVPLLGDLLGVDLGPAGPTTAMTGQVRADNLQDLVVALLQRQAAERPTVVKMEDAHWLDGASWALAIEVARRVGSVLVVLTMRPRAEPWSSAFQALRSSAPVEVIGLDVLGPEDALALACGRLGVDAIPEAVGRRIVERSQGHPFFAEELVLAARDAGLLRVEGGVCTLAPGVDADALPFPDSLEAVVTERIDRLSPAEQLAVKVASVVGRLFALGLIRDVYPIADDRHRLAEHLLGLVRRDITRPADNPSGIAYLFKHIVTREVAYGLLLAAQRRALHREVALWHERAGGDHALLAHHWARAGDDDRAVAHLEPAADAALRGGAYHEAASLYREAIQRANNAGAVEPARLARWESGIAAACLAIGRSAESRDAVLSALARSGHAAPSSPLGIAARFPAVIIRQAWHQLVGPSRGRDPAGLRELAGAYEILGQLCYYAQQTPLGILAALRGLNLAERAGPSPILARSYATMVIAASLVPWHGLADLYAAKAEAVAEHDGDPNARAWVAELTGIYDLVVGRFASARERFGRALALAEELGDRRRWEETIGELARLDYLQGDPVSSLRRFRAMGEAAADRGHAQASTWSRHGSAKALIALGRLDEAIERLESSPAIHEEGADAILGLGLFAVARRLRGEPNEARRLADECLRRIEAHGRPMVNFTLEGYAGTAEIYLGLWGDDPRRADAALKTNAARSVAALRAFAAIFPIGEPRHLLDSGRLAWLRGRQARGLRLVRRSLERSQALGIPLAERAAHRALAVMTMGDEAVHHEAEARRLADRIAAPAGLVAGEP